MHLPRHPQRVSTEPISIDFEHLRAREAQILQAEKARNTTATYQSSWRTFQAWCQSAGRPSLPTTTETLRDFVSWCLVEKYRLLTIRTRLAAIRHYHLDAGHASPCDATIRQYLSCARRELKERPRGKDAITYELLCGVVDSFPGSPLGLRNRSMVLLAFASGWRRSEVVALELSDVRFVEQGIELFQRSSKTDQIGRGRAIGIQRGDKARTCPVAALEAWLKARGDWPGALFPRFAGAGRTMTRMAPVSSSDIIYRPLLRALARLEADPRRYGAHSLRAGMITEAAKSGATEAAIMQRTGHRSREMVQRYIRPASAFDFNPLANVL